MAAAQSGSDASASTSTQNKYSQRGRSASGATRAARG